MRHVSAKKAFRLRRRTQIHQNPAANVTLDIHGKCNGPGRALALEDALIVRFDVVPGTGEEGEKLHVTPAGSPEQLSATGCTNPLIEPTDTIAVA